MKISVKVPATAANLGPGFDCLGVALPIFNTITIEETVLPGTGIEINAIKDETNIEDVILDHTPMDENSLIYKAVELLYNSIGQSPSELKITVQTQIPITRGLGSSASVIVGGLLAANELLGHPADEQALLSLAAELEGHPDNTTPAITGGMVISSQEDDGSVVYSKLDWPSEWNITVCVPDFELSTDISRSVLPKDVPLEDAVFNLKRFGMFVQAVNTRDINLMKRALQDKLHQPYRMKLVPGLERIIDNLKHEEDVFGCVLSGSGQTIIVISLKSAVEKIKSTVKETWKDMNVKVNIMTLPVEQYGAQVLSND